MTQTSFVQIVKQVLAVVALTLVAARALGEVSGSLESLGSRRAAIERATRLESRTKVGLVHGRAIDRKWRIELGANYGPAAFGDSYLNTQMLGGALNIHINSAFSLGVHYAKAFNQLSAEGQSRFDQARVDTMMGRPEVSYPNDQVMGVLNWYMTYGKMNLFDWRTVQFDIYSLVGYGQISTGTNTGDAMISTGTWTAGGGIAFWLAEHLSSRFELRYQGYSDQHYSGSRDIGIVVGTFGLGVLL